MLSIGVILFLLHVSASPLASANEKDTEFRELVVQGRALAERSCSACHAVGLTDESPTSVNRNTSFRRLYERFPILMLTEAAKTGSISGHDEMPGFDFTINEVKALLAYIDSVTPTGQPTYVQLPGPRSPERKR